MKALALILFVAACGGKPAATTTTPPPDDEAAGSGSTAESGDTCATFTQLVAQAGVGFADVRGAPNGSPDEGMAEYASKVSLPGGVCAIADTETGPSMWCEMNGELDAVKAALLACSADWSDDETSATWVDPTSGVTASVELGADEAGDEMVMVYFTAPQPEMYEE